MDVEPRGDMADVRRRGRGAGETVEVENRVIRCSVECGCCCCSPSFACVDRICGCDTFNDIILARNALDRR